MGDFDYATLEHRLRELAFLLDQVGKPEQAEPLLQRALETYEQLGYRRERAGTLGEIARILRSKGDVDEALILNREQLETYEQLGDRRSRAVNSR